MSTSQTESDPTTDQPGALSSKRKKWAVILTPAVLISLLGLLFGNNLVQQWQVRHDKDKPPSFEISAINTLGDRNIYEITNHIRSATPAEPITITWGLQVIPTYKGERTFGEVRVLVKDRQGQVLAEGKWDNFDKESKPLLVGLDPYRLCSEVGSVDLAGGFQESPFGGGAFTPPETAYDVEIVPASHLNEPLMTDKLILRNSPWYHYATASAWRGNSMDIHVYGKNLGGPSDFAVIGEIFEINDLQGSPWNPWPRVDYKEVLVAGVASGQELTATLSFPAINDFRFEKGKLYVASIFLSKEQNYIVFPDGAWQRTGHKWRLGSYSTRLLVSP